MFNSDPQTSRRCYISSAHLIEAILSHFRGYGCFVKIGEGEWICPSRPVMLLRGFLHFLINGLGFLLIWLTVPVLVSFAHSPLDYIMNLFAITYLTQLDDVAEEKMFLIRFEAVAGEGAIEPSQGSPSAGRPRCLEAQPEQHIPLMDLPSLLVAQRGSTNAGMMSRISLLELENLDLKHRLAALEAKIGS
jgi:hypothetical protein